MLRGKLTYANVVSTMCLFILLGGGAYAATKLPKNSVGAKQLKDGAVTGVKVKDGSLSGSDIDISSLATVPNASHAANADQAANALRLEGSPGSAYRDHCPSETESAPVDLCVSTAPLINVQYEDALRICAEKGLRIPTPSEAYTLDLTATLTDDYWTEGPKSYALLMNERIFEKVETPNDLNGYEAYCVTTPSDR